MKATIDVHCNRDLIDILQDEKPVGQIEENQTNDHTEWKHWMCHNLMKNPIETQYFDTFKEALLWLENII
jgi:hypothetical protein